MMTNVDLKRLEDDHYHLARSLWELEEIGEHYPERWLDSERRLKKRMMMFWDKVVKLRNKAKGKTK